MNPFFAMPSQIALNTMHTTLSCDRSHSNLPDEMVCFSEGSTMLRRHRAATGTLLAGCSGATGLRSVAGIFLPPGPHETPGPVPGAVRRCMGARGGTLHKQRGVSAERDAFTRRYQLPSQAGGHYIGM